MSNQRPRVQSHGDNRLPDRSSPKSKLGMIIRAEDSRIGILGRRAAAIWMNGFGISPMIHVPMSRPRFVSSAAHLMRTNAKASAVPRYSTTPPSASSAVKTMKLKIRKKA